MTKIGAKWSAKSGMLTLLLADRLSKKWSIFLEIVYSLRQVVGSTLKFLTEMRNGFDAFLVIGKTARPVPSGLADVRQNVKSKNIKVHCFSGYQGLAVDYQGYAVQLDFTIGSRIIPAHMQIDFFPLFPCRGCNVPPAATIKNGLQR